MTLYVSVAAITASLNAVLSATEAGTGESHLKIYSGTVPANEGTALTTQTMLVDFQLPADIWDTVASDANRVYADMLTVTPVNAAADGTATFFRLEDGNAAVIMQGSVTAVGGGGNVELSAVDIITGIEITVVSFRFGQPRHP